MLIKLLDDESWTLRWIALRGLLDAQEPKAVEEVRKPEILELIVRRLKDEDDWSNRQPQRFLIRHGDGTTFIALEQLLSDPSPDVREHASKVITAIRQRLDSTEVGPFRKDRESTEEENSET